MLSNDLLRHLVQAAGMAPSIRSTQPWRFALGHDRIDLHADLSRRLPDLDPTGRQLHVSCGAALLHVRIAARALGLDVRVERFPDWGDPTHLATLHLDWGAPPTDEEASLATAILQRHTGPARAVDARPLPDALLERIRLDVEREGSVLVRVAEQDVASLERMLDVPVPIVPPQREPDVVILATSADDVPSWLSTGQALAALLLRGADLGLLAQPLGDVTAVVPARDGLRRMLHLAAVPQMALQVGFAASAPRDGRRPTQRVSARPDHVAPLRVAG